MSGYIEPEPITPRMPVLADAAASSQPLHQTIPAWIMGYFIFNKFLKVIIKLFRGKISKNYHSPRGFQGDY